MANSIVKGSLAEVAKAANMGIAQAFLDVEMVILVDVSSSMEAKDSVGQKSRYDQACRELQIIQDASPGKLAILAFSDSCIFCPSGIPKFLGGRTNVAGALRFAKQVDIPGIKLVLISDGEPDDEQAALTVAATFRSRIDCIFVGPEERPAGRDFLRQLAAASGGVQVTADRVQNLGSNVQKLLAATA